MLLRTLWEAPSRANTTLPAELRARYAGELRFPAHPSPYLIANFVATADGVASFGVPGQAGGGAISGDDAGDRFTMGLLRARADAVLVGAATLRQAGRRALWDPAFTAGAAAPALRRWRRARGLPPSPLLVAVTASGRLPLDYDVFHAPGSRVLVLSSAAGAACLRKDARRRQLKLDVRVLAPEAGRIPVRALLRLLRREAGVRTLLCEGGPSLFGALVRARLVHELFLSVAPRLAGRDAASPRPGIIAAAAFAPAQAPPLRLLSVKEHAGLLLLRYRFTAGFSPNSHAQ